MKAVPLFLLLFTLLFIWMILLFGLNFLHLFFLWVFWKLPLFKLTFGFAFVVERLALNLITFSDRQNLHA